MTYPFDPKKYPNCTGAIDYALAVLDEIIPTSIYTFAACERFMEDIERTDEFNLRWDKAERFMRLFQRFHHVIGEWDTPNIMLEGWQKFFFTNAELFYWKHNGKRRYKAAHLEVARGNGKSAVASCTGLIYLNLVEVVKGNKVYSCATKKEQARIVLDSAREMAKANRSYIQKTGAEVFAHHIAHEESGSEFRALSSDSKSLDGLQPVLAIIDELHAHKDRAVYDVIDSAMSKRRDSFMLIITTAGFSLEGIGYSQSQYAKKVALGEIDDDSFFSLVYTLDEDDDWKDPENWLKANPNWGVSVDPDSFKSKALKAMANPVDEINFKVKHLNLWQNAMSQYFSVKLWNKLGNPALTLEKFRGQKCFVGIDLASKIDLTAIAFIFKDEKTGKYSIITKSYCPEGTIQTSKNNSYVGWVSEGHLIQTNGQAINYPKLRKDFLQDVRTVKAQEIAYDPWNAVEFSQELTNERLEMVEYRMNTANFSEPMKRLEALIREGMIEHDGNPLVSWCLGNVVAKPDANDNVFPRKDHESLKIDVIIAILEALGLWIQYEEQTSVYEKRELRIL